MRKRTLLLKKVADVYNRLDAQTAGKSDVTGSCRVCGRCCDFDEFEHRLFVTTPELMYLSAKLGDANIKAMSTGRCPYNAAGRCTIYKYRFAGCRIFSCGGDKDFQSLLSESALREFKSICREFNIPYRYEDLPTALTGFAASTETVR